jgi:hypothetical protein
MQGFLKSSTTAVRAQKTVLNDSENQNRLRTRAESKRLRRDDSLEVIEFKYVGSQDRSWNEKILHPQKGNIDLDAVLKSVLEKGGLATPAVEVDYNEEKNRGVIYAEISRPVGSFRVIE